MYFDIARSERKKQQLMNIIMLFPCPVKNGKEIGFFLHMKNWGCNIFDNVKNFFMFVMRKWTV